MKKLFFLLMFILLIFACRDDKKDDSGTEAVQRENKIPSDTTSGEPDGELLDESATEKDGVETEIEKEEPEITESSAGNGMIGKFKLMDADGNTGTCMCSCIDISFTSPSELCISQDKIYINARFAKNGSNKANIFFEGVVRDEETEREIPWKEFDKDTPIATVIMTPNGMMELDWLGFSINGEIAVDYAIYGKKTLEGKYKKD